MYNFVSQLYEVSYLDLLKINASPVVTSMIWLLTTHMLSQHQIVTTLKIMILYMNIYRLIKLNNFTLTIGNRYSVTIVKILLHLK